MWPNFSPIIAAFPLFPPVASEQAGKIDALYFFESAVMIIMTALIFAGVIYFAYRYRKSAHPQATQIEGSTKLELFWSISPFIVMLVMFAWGADLYYAAQNPPKNALEVFVTGKQWMWKVQYPSGGREINELHVPVGQPVKLTMASEDVIHSFSVPAFRVRHDVVPGHYSSIWFTASKPGEYHLFCTEYCGLWHSKMRGTVYAMEPKDYATWVSGGGAQGTLAEQGQKLFEQYGCVTCHLSDQPGRCPNLKGLYNKPVQLNDGSTVLANDAYLRESILDPNAKIVNGYEADVMPHFKGQITEEQVIQLIAFIKSESPTAPASQTGPAVRQPVEAGKNAKVSTKSPASNGVPVQGAK